MDSRFVLLYFCLTAIYKKHTQSDLATLFLLFATLIKSDSVCLCVCLDQVVEGLLSVLATNQIVETEIFQVIGHLYSIRPTFHTENLCVLIFEIVSHCLILSGFIHLSVESDARSWSCQLVRYANPLLVPVSRLVYEIDSFLLSSKCYKKWVFFVFELSDCPLNFLGNFIRLNV